MRPTSRVTIQDIAEHLGLAKSTVSYALNGGPRVVSKEVRERVSEAAAKFGYRANPVALSLATQRTRTIGFVPSSLRHDAMTNPVAQVALQTLYRVAHQHEMHVLLPSGYDPSRSQETYGHLLSAPVDGIILLQPAEPQAMGALRAKRVPLMSIIGVCEGLIPTINADNAGGTRLAVEHLVALGHERIGCLYDSSHFDTQARFSAFQRLSDALSLPGDPGLAVRSGLTHHEGYAAAKELLSRKERPTGVVCVNDHVAAGTVRAAVEAGLRVPEDLSVVGFDDDVLARTCVVPLTTVRQPVEEMALAAFRGLLDQIDGKPSPDQVLPCTLIARGSSAAPRRAR